MNDARDIHWLKIAEAAQYLGVSDETLRRWEARGILIPQRTPGNQRRYTEVQLEAFERRRAGSEVAEDVLPQQSFSNLQGLPLHRGETIPADRPSILKAIKEKRSAPILMTLGGFLVLGSLVAGAIHNSSFIIHDSDKPQIAGVTTEAPSGMGSVLAAIAEANQSVFFSVTVPAFFNNVATFKDAVTFEQDITAPNVIYSVTGGDGITVTGGQNPTVSITDPNVDAYTKIKVGDTTMTAGEEDTLTFAASGNTSVSIDTTNKKVTFSSTSPDLSAAGGWTDSGTVVELTTDGDVVSIGGSDSTASYNVIGDSVAGASVNVDSDDDLYIEGNLEVDGTIYGNVSGTLGTSLTEGSVTFIDAAGAITEDNVNFFWDDTNNRLGIGDNTPQYSLDVAGTLHAGGATTLSSTLDVSGDTNLLSTLDVTGAGVFLSTLEVTGNIDFNGSGTNDIAGTLNLSGNTLTASGDLVINPTGGGTKIGTGTPVSADMAGSDLYVTGDFEVGGTIYGGLSGTVTTSFSQGSIVFINGGGNLAEDNTNFFWDDTNNRLGIGDSTPSYALDVNGTANVNGAATFNGTIVFGDAVVDTVTFNGYIASHLIPNTASTYDLGDATRTWRTLYVDSIVAANISTTATDLNGTSAQSFTINNDNVTADTESSSLVFDRGTPSVNASLGWDATSKWLEVNSSTFAVNADGETGITYSGKAALLVNQVQNQDLIAASASGSTRFKVDINGEITASGIGEVKIIDGNEYAQTCAGINAAIDALPSTGGKIYLPEATYVCNETVTIDVNNTTIEGSGPGSVITAASAANGGTGQSFGHVINLNGKDNLILRDFKILGNAGGGSTNDLISDGSSQVTDSLFENLTLVSSDDSAWSQQAYSASHTRNIFNNNQVSSNDGSAFVYFHVDSNTTFSNNIIRNNGGYGIYLEAASYIKITGNHFENNTSGALSGEAASNLTISGNVFYSHLTGSPLTIRFFRGTDIVVSDNIFNNNYISIQADRRDTGGYIISNNIFVGSASTLYAILLSGSGSAPGTVVSGNYISGYSAVSAIGIYINGIAQSDAKIVNNSFRSNTTDITDLGATTNVINSNNGNTVIGGADNSPDATLELYRASSSDPRFVMSDGDVAHGVTTLADTDVFLNVGTISSTIGGARITGLADADGQALELLGVQSSNPTDTTPAVKIVAAKASGTGVVDLAAAETVFSIANNDNASSFYVLGDGKVYAPKLNKVVTVDGTVYAQTCAGINAAIDALGSSGGEVYLPEATYTCAETITIDQNNTTIRGAGPGTIISGQPASTDVIDLNGKDYLTLRDFKINGTAGTGNAGNLIGSTVNGVTYTLLENLVLDNSDAYAYVMGSSDSSVTVRNVAVIDPDGYGMQVAGTFNEISNCSFEEIGNSGIFLVGVDNSKIVNNTFNMTSSVNHGILANGGETNNVIGYNTIFNVRSAGIYLNGASTNNTIIGNTVDTIRDDSGANSGIYLGSTSADYNIVTGNSIDFGSSSSQGNGFGIRVISDNNTITGNNIYNNAAAGTSHGIYLSSTASYNTISGNTISGFNNASETGINISASGNTDNVVSGNQLEDNTTDISDAGTNTAFVNAEDGNTVIGGADATPDTTLELFKASGSDVTFSFTDGDVVHGVTTLANTDAFFHVGAISSTVGGTRMTAFADADGQAFEIKGVQSSDPTDTTPAVKIVAAKASGTGVVDLGAAETVFSVANNDDSDALTIQGNGDVGIGTNNPTSKLHVVGETLIDLPGTDFSITETAGTGISLTSTSHLYYIAATNRAHIWNVSSTEVMRIESGGSAIGMFTNAPGAKLEIAALDADNDELLYLDTEESTVSQTVFALESDTTGNSQSVDTVKAHFEADGSLFVSLTGTQTTNGLCHTGSAQDNNDEIVDCSGAPSDYAEWYPAKTDVGVGDIVSVSDEMFTYDAEGSDPFTGQITQMGSKTIGVLAKATSATSTVGIVSTGPYSVIGEDVKKSVEQAGNSGLKPVPLALNGRVPVNIASDSQPIAPGDELMLSETQPGKAMKAKGAGNIVGKALSTWSPNTEESTVMAFVQNTWSSGNALYVEGEAFSLSQLAQMVVSHEQQMTDVVNSFESIYASTISSDTTISVNAEVLDTLIVRGSLVVEKDATFKGETIFEKLVTFVLDVVFKGKVKFEQSPEFGRDSAGYAIIHQYTDRVDVAFDREYDVPPVVTMSLMNATDSAFLAEGSQATVSNVTGRGFSIALSSPAIRDYTYAWSAVRVSDPRTSESSTSILEAIQNLEASDSGTLDPGSEPGMTENGEVAGFATPSAEASPSATP